MKQSVQKILFCNRRRTAVFITATLLLSVVAPMKSYIIQWLIDAENLNAAYKSLAVGIAVVLASHGLELISRQVYTRMATEGIGEIRIHLVKKQLKKPMAQYLSEDTGDILSCLTNDINVLYEDYYMALFDICFWGGMGVVALIMITFISPALLVVIILVGMLPLMVPKLMSSRLKDARNEYTQDIAGYTSKIGDLLKGFEALLSCNALSYFDRVHSNAAKSNGDKSEKLYSQMNIAMVLASLAAWIPNLMILVTGVILVFRGSITIGYLVTAQALGSFVLTPCRFVSNAYAKLNSSQSVKRKIEECMNLAEEQDGTNQLMELKKVEVDNLSFHYPSSEKEILHKVQLSLQKGEKIAFVGESGCGKTTFLRMLFRYYYPSQGVITINGESINHYSKESFYEKIQMIPQKPYIFHDTLWNNLCMYQDYTKEEVEAAVMSAGLQDYLESLENGMDTELQESGKNISGGQAQRIAIARALLHRCELLLVDEATASLDVTITNEIMKQLLNLDNAVIIITHDIYGEYMNQFDQIYYIENGQILEHGKYEELINQHGYLWNLYKQPESRE